MFIIMCDADGCKNYANITFQEGTKMEKCPTCGHEKNVDSYREMCYEHAHGYMVNMCHIHDSSNSTKTKEEP